MMTIFARELLPLEPRLERAASEFAGLGVALDRLPYSQAMEALCAELHGDGWDLPVVPYEAARGGRRRLWRELRRLKLRARLREAPDPLAGLAVRHADSADQALLEAFVDAGRQLEDLPYTPEFDALAARLGVALPAHDGAGHRRFFFWRRLLALRRGGLLPRVPMVGSVGDDDEEP